MKLRLRRTSFISGKFFSQCMLLTTSWLFVITTSAQVDYTAFENDTTSLSTVEVKAFIQTELWKDVPSSVAVLNKPQIQKFDGNGSLLTAFNTIPGVRMEERSPGSYRISLRGSLLRSSFGVRNVKVYYDEFPLTEANGTTYFNLVNNNDLKEIVVLKGPGASTYGANTGGVILLKSPEYLINRKDEFTLGLTGGSYGLLNQQSSWTHQGNRFFSVLNQSHVQADGYRDNTKSRRDIIKWNGKYTLSDKHSLNFLAFYADIFYQIPGGLTEAQYLENRRASRPGAIENKVAAYNKTGYGGVNLASKLSDHITHNLVTTVNYTDFKNPFLTNYETRNEWNLSLRDYATYHTVQNDFAMDFTAGGELLYNTSRMVNYGNVDGNPDTLQLINLFHVNQYFLFAQANIVYKDKLTFQAGASYNATNYYYRSATDSIFFDATRLKAGPIIAPKFSLLYNINKDVSSYATISRGFSPPTILEVNLNNISGEASLMPEDGFNYEVGVKGIILNNNLTFDLSAYNFRLKNSIVRKINEDDEIYYVNAGSTSQKGIEAYINYLFFTEKKGIVSSLQVYNSFTYQPYKYDEYINDGKDYSGNDLTGTPEHVNVSGFDATFKYSFYFSTIFNYTSTIPLNDANTIYADRVRLWQLKAGKYFNINKVNLNVFFIADNVLNEEFSLGNDINAFGGRFYNAAPGINYQAGIKAIF